MAEETRIGLVGCVKGKRSEPAPARDLYTSTLFSGRGAWVERSCDRWFILSALHGLISPDAILEPYDVALTGASRRERRRWSQRVLSQLDVAVPDVAGVVFEVHAGADYRDFGLVDGLRSRGAVVENPTEGLGQGQQLAFYGHDRTETRSTRVIGRSGWHAPKPISSGTPSWSASGKYRPLADLLKAQSGLEVSMAFGDLEVVLGCPLPTSARKHRPWWANHPSHSQALAWLGAGWQVSGVDMSGEHVTFRRQES